MGISIFQFATGEREFTPKEAGITALILIAGPVGGKLIKTFVRGKVNKTISAAISSGTFSKILIKNGKVNEIDLKRMIEPGAI